MFLRCFFARFRIRDSGCEVRGFDSYRDEKVYKSMIFSFLLQASSFQPLKTTDKHCKILPILLILHFSI